MCIYVHARTGVCIYVCVCVRETEKFEWWHVGVYVGKIDGLGCMWVCNGRRNKLSHCGVGMGRWEHTNNLTPFVVDHEM